MRLNVTNMVLLWVLGVCGPQAMAASSAADQAYKEQMAACNQQRRTSGLPPAEQHRAVRECYRQAQAEKRQGLAAERSEKAGKEHDETEAARDRLKDSRMAAEMTCVKEMKAAGTVSADKKESRAAIRECADKKLKPREDKVDECNEKAVGKSGDERKAFMKACLGPG